MFVCRYCNQEKLSHNSWRNHERLCSKNPEKQTSNLIHYNKIPWNKGLDKSDPRIARHAASVSKTSKGRPNKVIWTEEMRKEKSKWRKKLHKDFPETHPNRRLANNKSKMTYPEKVAAEWLNKNNIKYEHNKKIDNFYPDFIIDKIIIEIDGEHWHDKEKDSIRDSILNNLGYTVYRIGAKERIEEKLNELLGVG